MPPYRRLVELSACWNGSKIVGSPPILIEECEIVAIAEGRDGFQSAARY